MFPNTRVFELRLDPTQDFSDAEAEAVRGAPLRAEELILHGCGLANVKIMNAAIDANGSLVETLRVDLETDMLYLSLLPDQTQLMYQTLQRVKSFHLTVPVGPCCDEHDADEMWRYAGKTIGDLPRGTLQHCEVRLNCTGIGREEAERRVARLPTSTIADAIQGMRALRGVKFTLISDGASAATSGAPSWANIREHRRKWLDDDLSRIPGWCISDSD